MDNSRRSNFMGEINARQYNINPRVVQPNNQNRVNQNIRNNNTNTHGVQPNNRNRINNNIRNDNTHPQYKRTLKDSFTTFMRPYKRYINKRTLTIAALIAAAGLTTGVIMDNNTNKNIDNIRAAYQYTDNVLSQDERAVNKEGYQDYIDKMVAFDRTFEESNKEEFHDFVKDLGLEDKVLDSEQITNLALEVFKVAFGEKNGVDPRSVTIDNREPDVTQMSKEYDYKMGKYKCTSITYTTRDGQEEKLINDYLTEGYFPLGIFEPSGDIIYYSNDIPDGEYDVINTILASQSDKGNTRKSIKALKEAQEYAEKVKGEIEQEQSGDERED